MKISQIIEDVPVDRWVFACCTLKKGKIANLGRVQKKLTLIKLSHR